MLRKLIIYMPALNEEKTISQVINSIPKTIIGFRAIEILVVNDGSTDQTVSEAKKAGATVLSHNKNKGVGDAFQSAINYALQTKAEALVSIDADGQFDVNQIPEMLAPILNNQADFCIGIRFTNGKPDNMPKIKFWGNKKVNQIVSFVSNTKIHDASCGFRAYSNDTLLSLNLHGSFTYTHETILDLLDKGFNVEQIPVRVQYFEDRVSRIANNLFQYAFKTSSIIFKSLKDYKPLQFFLGIAFFTFLVALFFGGWALTHWIVYDTITPYKSFGIIGLSLLGMSVVVTIFSFMADMLGRIRKNQEKILYFLKKTHFENPER
ncbi:glycosyltransferase family 2 protein [Flavobacterium degerlachei]|jgi:glycosyltransferase involved in cell wall biosynthesis|uniref:Glycosyltransferase involved in cell wall bisynthesis n=1 Tax=Flavobacterium degerlachei TaxID=229203 RepID=A0A1H2VZ21_9FLAO|nr:glycosyltransferase family 2 protein [Flavobacterium degerlachei]SDW73099.1 Glycosyltransferase involved in cell wall bisynthesis [Flavobacterium degerlachei]